MKKKSFSFRKYEEIDPTQERYHSHSPEGHTLSSVTHTPLYLKQRSASNQSSLDLTCVNICEQVGGGHVEGEA